MIYLKRYVDLRWLFGPVLHSSLYDLVIIIQGPKLFSFLCCTILSTRLTLTSVFLRTKTRARCWHQQWIKVQLSYSVAQGGVTLFVTDRDRGHSSRRRSHICCFCNTTKVLFYKIHKYVSWNNGLARNNTNEIVITVLNPNQWAKDSLSSWIFGTHERTFLHTNDYFR